jgi:hypothetical protein
MNDVTPLVLTVEEGNNLLGISSAFACPDQLGEGRKYSNAERGLANSDVAALFWGLRELSPILQGKSRMLWFGPEDAYQHAVDRDSGTVGRRVTDPSREVTIMLDAKQLRGLVWCLFVRLHPQSGAVSGAGEQVCVIWPIAKKAGYVEYLEEEIGLQQAQPRVIKRDKSYLKLIEGDRAKEA